MTEPGASSPLESRVTKRIFVGSLCAMLGGICGVGVGAAFRGMTEGVGRFGPILAPLIGWATAAAVSLTTAAVWLKIDLPRAAKSLWSVYLGAVIVSLVGVRVTLFKGATGVPTIGGWGWAWLPLFSGAWTSLVLSAGILIWTWRTRRETARGITMR